jgi:hypothetical protein
MILSGLGAWYIPGDGTQNVLYFETRNTFCLYIMNCTFKNSIHHHSTYPHLLQNLADIQIPVLNIFTAFVLELYRQILRLPKLAT